MAITRARVENLLADAILKYGTSFGWSKFNKPSTVIQSGYDSLYEESVTHHVNTTSGFVKAYFGEVVFSGYPILSVTPEFLKTNGLDQEVVDLVVVSTDAFLAPTVGVITPNSLQHDVLVFSGTTYQIIGNKPVGFFQPDFIGHWIFCRYFEES